MSHCRCVFLFVFIFYLLWQETGIDINAQEAEADQQVLDPRNPGTVIEIEREKEKEKETRNETVIERGINIGGADPKRKNMTGLGDMATMLKKKLQNPPKEKQLQLKRRNFLLNQKVN